MKDNISCGDVYDFINICISIDNMMKRINNHYNEIGYPVINGFQTDYISIHEFDAISNETINSFESRKNYKKFKESIKDPEVEAFVDRLVYDAKTGAMPFNDSSLTNETASKHLIYNCLAMECVDGVTSDTTIDITKKLYDTCEEELKVYQPYISSIIQNITYSDITDDNKPKVQQKNKAGK